MENAYTEEIDNIARRYQTELTLKKLRGRPDTKPRRGWILVDLLVCTLRKYVPEGLRVVGGPIFVESLRDEWDLAIIRDGPVPVVHGKSRQRTYISPGQASALFEVKASGVVGYTRGGLRRVAAVKEALFRIRNAFITAKKTCPYLSLSCFFDLRERIPRLKDSIPYFDLIKCILEPDVLTVIPYSGEIPPEGPLPAKRERYLQEWRTLISAIQRM